MLQVNQLTGFGSGGAGIQTLTQVLSTGDGAGNTFTLPTGIQNGDLIVVMDWAIGSSAPTTVVPSGFTSLVNVTGTDGVVVARIIISGKIAVGGESGAVLSCMTGSGGPQSEGRLVYVFRGNVPITAFAVFDPASEFTSGNPAAQTVNASGGAPPLIVLGCYVAAINAVNPRTFNPAKDGEIQATAVDGPEDLWLAYKIYNSSPADVSIDMDDEGLFNALVSCYIQCT